MNLDDVRKIKVPRSKRHRVGRGPGSGWGKTSGRGHKGAGQRSGTRFRLRFEGGQMPLYRRLPKKGFNNKRFQTEFHVVNVGALERSFEAGARVDLGTLKEAGLAPKRARFIKILGFGELTRSLDLHVHAVSAGAREKVETSKGTIQLLPTEIEPRPKGVRKGARTDTAPTPAKTTSSDSDASPATEGEGNETVE